MTKAATNPVETTETKNSRNNKRLLSHTVIDVRPFRYLPLFTQSSYLLDISSGGLLLEFITKPRITPGRKYWMIGHLTPLGITDVQQFKCYLECRWVNPENCKMGGLFVDLDANGKRIIDLILQQIIEKSKNEPQGTKKAS